MQKLGGSNYGGYLLEGDVIAGVTSGATATVTKKHIIADDKGKDAIGQASLSDSALVNETGTLNDPDPRA